MHGWGGGGGGYNYLNFKVEIFSLVCYSTNNSFLLYVICNKNVFYFFTLCSKRILSPTPHIIPKSLFLMLFLTFPCLTDMLFEGGCHNSSKTRAVFKSTTFSKLSIQMKKTAIRDQNTGPIAMSLCVIYVTKYSLYTMATNYVQFLPS